jgi:hypothetical protein
LKKRIIPQFRISTKTTIMAGFSDADPRVEELASDVELFSF